MIARRSNPARRAATLIEAVVVVVVIAISVPPTLMWLDESAARRTDAVMIMRANALATAVLEQALADAVTTDIGLHVPAYLDTPGTGLRARLASLTAPYSAVGMSWTLDAGAKVGPLGVATGTVADAFRVVTATVSYTDSTGAAVSVPISTMVAVP